MLRDESGRLRTRDPEHPREFVHDVIASDALLIPRIPEIPSALVLVSGEQDLFGVVDMFDGDGVLDQRDPHGFSILPHRIYVADVGVESDHVVAHLSVVYRMHLDLSCGGIAKIL